MKPLPNHAKTCKHKKGFDTEAAAKAKCSAGAYLCTACGKWHGTTGGFWKVRQLAVGNEGTWRKYELAKRYERRRSVKDDGLEECER